MKTNNNNLREAYSRYQELLENLALKINTEGFLLSKECLQKIQTHVIVFVGLREKGIEQIKKYSNFLMDVSTCFDRLLRNEFWQKKEDSISEFKLSNINREEILKMGIVIFFDEEYERWVKWKKKI